MRAASQLENSLLLLHRDKDERVKIFNWLKSLGNIDEDEILKTLNCGIGLIVIVDPSNAKNISSYLNKINENHFVIGEITNNKKNNSGITYKRD